LSMTWLTPLFAGEKKPLRVTVDNFRRAETHHYFARFHTDGGFGKFKHERELASIDKQTVIRLNRDTLYSFGVFDLDAGHVNINAFNRRALLTGEVRDEAMKAAAEREIRAIEGVLSVINELEVAGPASYTSRSNDALITTKVKASLVDMKDISANSYQVVTERGVVYLQGRVTQREGQIGADVARGVSGVTKVVKVFEYITEEEWKTYQPKPASNS